MNRVDDSGFDEASHHRNRHRNRRKKVWRSGFFRGSQWNYQNNVMGAIRMDTRSRSARCRIRLSTVYPNCLAIGRSVSLFPSWTVTRSRMRKDKK